MPCQSFLDNRGVLTPISDPRATNGTFAYGINDAGQIVGVYGTASRNLGFVDTGGVFTTISVPGASYTYAYGTNEAGQVVGESCNASLECQSFLDTGGVFTTISVPGANTSARGINDAGEIVGFYIPQPPPTPEPGTDVLLLSGGLFIHFVTLDGEGTVMFGTRKYGTVCPICKRPISIDWIALRPNAHPWKTCDKGFLNKAGKIRR